MERRVGICQDSFSGAPPHDHAISLSLCTDSSACRAITIASSTDH
jgi:hypothetical protein